MIERAAKRRRVSETSDRNSKVKKTAAAPAPAPEEESYGSDDNQSADGSLVEGEEEHGEEEELDDEEELADSKVDAQRKPNGVTNRATRRVPVTGGASSTNATSEMSQSSLFKLQTEEMLRQVAPKYGKKEQPAVDMLRTIKDHIERIPERAPLPVCNHEVRGYM